MYKKELTFKEINKISSSIGKIQALANGIKRTSYDEFKEKWEKELIEETEIIFNIITKE